MEPIISHAVVQKAWWNQSYIAQAINFNNFLKSSYDPACRISSLMVILRHAEVLTLRASDWSFTFIGERIGLTPMQQLQQAMFTNFYHYKMHYFRLLSIIRRHIAQSSLSFSKVESFHFSVTLTKPLVGLIISNVLDLGMICGTEAAKFERLVTFARGVWELTGELRGGLLVVQWVKNIARRCALPTLERRQRGFGQLELWYADIKEFTFVIFASSLFQLIIMI